MFTVRPSALTGLTSPYPTVVMVTKMNQIVVAQVEVESAG